MPWLDRGIHATPAKAGVQFVASRVPRERDTGLRRYEEDLNCRSLSLDLIRGANAGIDGTACFAHLSVYIQAHEHRRRSVAQLG